MRKFFSLIAAVLFAGSMMASTPLNVDFTAGQGSWTINDVELGGLSYVWQQNKSYGMKASAYNKAAYAAESWLISPAFSLAEATTAMLTINHALNKGAATNLAVKASADGKTWSDLELSAWPAGDSWTFEEATADLSSFAGESAVKIAFVYVSTTDLCPTWEIKTVKVEDDAAGGGGGGEGGDEVVLDVVYAEAAYLAEYGAWQFNLYKDYNEETEEVTYPDLYIGVTAKSATALAGTYSAEAEIAFIEVDVAEGTTVEATSSSDLIVAHLGEGVYHYELSFVGDDGKTYKLDAIAETPAYDSETDADIELDEDGGGIIPPTSEDLATKGVHTLTPALVTDEAEGTGSFSKILDGIQLAWEGAFYNGTAKATNNDFRVYANKTMTITAGANIEKVEIAGLAKKGLAIVVSAGEVTTGDNFSAETTKADIEDPLIVIENINATSLKIDCNKQLQARIIRVTLEGAQGIEETLSEGKAVKVLHEGQLLIMKGDHTYTPMGQIVK